MAKRATRKKSVQKQQITMHYIKPATCPIYKIDGVYGGLTPRGDVLFHAFIERPALPQQTRYELTDDERLGNEIDRVSKEDYIRDIQFGVTMTPPAAKALAAWLIEKAAIAENMTSISKEKNKSV